MRYSLSKILCGACVLVLLSVVAASAFGEIRYPDRALNLRDGRSAHANWVGSLVPGQTVKVAFLENGWVAVFEPDETLNDESAAVGYANLKYLKTSRMKPGKMKWGRLMETNGETPLRAKASGLSERIGGLPGGERVRVDFPDDDWVMVFPPKATIRSQMGSMGYVKNSVLRPVTVQKATPSIRSSISERANNDARDTYTEWGKVFKVEQPLKIYRERTTDSRLETTFPPGKRVRVDFLKDGWYAVFEEGEELRKEYRAVGYARQDQFKARQVEKKSVSLSETLAEATAKESDTDRVAPSSRKTIPIDRSRITGEDRPDPKPDRTLHGYKYKLMRKGESKKHGETWITLKVFLASTKLPNQAALEDFATSLWKEYRRVTKNVSVLIYLPGMNTQDVAYGVVHFNDEKLLESWVRRTALFGTSFL